MRISFPVRIILVLAGLTCLIASAAQLQGTRSLRSAPKASGAVVSGNVSITLARD